MKLSENWIRIRLNFFISFDIFSRKAIFVLQIDDNFLSENVYRITVHLRRNVGNSSIRPHFLSTSTRVSVWPTIWRSRPNRVSNRWSNAKVFPTTLWRTAIGVSATEYSTESLIGCSVCCSPCGPFGRSCSSNWSPDRTSSSSDRHFQCHQPITSQLMASTIAAAQLEKW